ncbi:MAG: exosortase K [Flavobacteriales bacterium]|nr:exosortase K [Flavobacteriales bacterium]
MSIIERSERAKPTNWFGNTTLLVLLTYLGVAGAINRGLSNDQLQFLLYPIQLLVGHFQNSQFQYFPAFGYVQTTGAISINASCSGFLFFNVLNAIGLFLIWKMTGPLWRFSSAVKTSVVILMAYISTILVNASRILLSLDLLKVSQTLSWFPDRFAHEAFGIFSFLIFSILYYITINQILKQWTN